MIIRIVFTGRSYQMASEMPDQLTLSDGAHLDDAIASLTERMADDLPASCLVSLSGKHLGTLASHENAALADGDEIILIAPVAGG